MRRASIFFVCTVLWLAGCQAVNTTQGGAVGISRTQFMMPGVSSEQLNQEYAKSYHDMQRKAVAKGALDKSSAMAKRVQNIANRLINQTSTFRSDAQGWQWETSLIKSNELNANVGPGGKIVVYTGLITQLNLTDDELAAVMGHEISHALREHSRESISRAYASQLAKQSAVALLGIGQAGSQLADIAMQYGMTLPNSRSNESEADLMGIELAARAGFNPSAAISLWEKMGHASNNAPPEFLSTHPSSSSRIAELRAAIPRVIPLYEKAKLSR